MGIFKFLFIFLVMFSTLFAQVSKDYNAYNDTACYLMCEHESLDQIENDTDIKILFNNENSLKYPLYNQNFFGVFTKNRDLFSSKPFKPPRS